MLIVVPLLIFAGMVAMTQKVPKGFTAPDPISKNEQVTPYLTHYLAPNVHNNIQFDKPFEVIVPQKGINEIIAEERMLGWQWPVQLGKITVSKPVVNFAPETINIMAKVDVAGFDTIITICAKPSIDEEGLLQLNFQHVRAGTLGITYLAKSVIKMVIEDQINEVDEHYWLKDILAASQENKPFQPIFPTVYSKYIKLIKSDISQNKLILIFEPSTGPETADTSNEENEPIYVE